VAIEFDPAKDAGNVQTHGISLARAADLEVLAIVEDPRFEEPRFRAYGLIDGEAYCLAYAIRGPNVRAISLRRAHQKEVHRYASSRWPG
jgi:uncharacterized DUF497 family protein